MRLNLGCGDFRAEGWINIDGYADAMRSPDVIADISSGLPIAYGVASRLYAGHVLEHLPYDRVVGVLDEWHRHAAPSAQLLVVGPDCDRGRQWLHNGRMSPEEFASLTIRESTVPGQSHLWDCTENKMLELLRTSQWQQSRAVDIVDVPSDWPLVSRIGWQFAIMSTANT